MGIFRSGDIGENTHKTQINISRNGER